jgi:succinate dehydrogenase / fumarate reductase cytochrome b subunit
MHIRHGFWSGFATLGANTSAGTRKVLDGLAYAIAVLLFLAFMAPPVAVFFGLVK